MSDSDARHWEAVEEATELMLEGKHAEALELLKDAIENDPKNAYAYQYIGAAMYELEKLEPSRDAYRAALKLAPNYLAARVGISHVLRKLGKLDGALNQAKEALRRFPEDGGALFAAGLAYAEKGKRSEARQHLERFLQTHPELEAQLEARSMIEMLMQGEDDEPLGFV